MYWRIYNYKLTEQRSVLIIGRETIHTDLHSMVWKHLHDMFGASHNLRKID